MIDFFIQYFQELIIANGALAIFFVGVLEDIFFFVPSSLVFMGSGFVLIAGDLDFWQALGWTSLLIGIPASAGVTFGALFIYGVVYKLGKPVVIKYGKYLGVSWDEIEQVRQKFATGYSDELALFIMRAIPVFPLSIASILSGMIRMPWKAFVAVSLCGVFVRATVSAMIGWGVGKEYMRYAAQFDVVEKYGMLVLAVIVTAFLIWHWRRHRGKKIENRK